MTHCPQQSHSLKSDADDRVAAGKYADSGVRRDSCSPPAKCDTTLKIASLSN